ncbi:hypothetical protein Tco_1439849, partial [Tanacetum coccineum]
GRYGDDLAFDISVLDGEKVFAGQDVVEMEVSTADPVTTVGEVVTIASVEFSVVKGTLVSAATTITITAINEVDLTLAYELAGLRSAKPKVVVQNAVKRIFRYLKHQPKLGLWYPRDSPFELEAFSDNDYGGASLDRKSTTGGCQFLGRRLISWQCKKQTIVANSTTKAEYVAAANCCRQVLWIQNVTPP